MEAPLPSDSITDNGSKKEEKIIKTHSIDLAFKDKQFKLTLILNLTKIQFSLLSKDIINENIYLNELQSNTFGSLSKYFKMFDNLEEIFDNLVELSKNNKILIDSISKDSSIVILKLLIFLINKEEKVDIILNKSKESKLNENVLEKIINEINDIKVKDSEINKKYNLLECKYTELDNNYQNLNKDKENLNNNYNDLNKKYNELNEKYNELSTKYSELNKEYNDLKNKINNSEKYSHELKEDIDKLSKSAILQNPKENLLKSFPELEKIQNMYTKLNESELLNSQGDIFHGPFFPFFHHRHHEGHGFPPHWPPPVFHEKPHMH